MSRFVNLELGGESEDQTPQKKALVKDEAYYQAEAKTAFENGEFEQALRLYGKVLEFNPNGAAAWTGQKGSRSISRASRTRSASPFSMMRLAWAGSVIMPTAAVGRPASA